MAVCLSVSLRSDENEVKGKPTVKQPILFRDV